MEQLPEKTPRAGTHLVSVAAFEYYKAANGLTDDAVRAKARISVRTLERIREGKPVRISTIRMIAERAFKNLEIDMLLARPPAAGQRKTTEQDYVEFDFRVRVPFSRFKDPEKWKPLSAFLKEVIGISNPIIIDSAAPGGSVIFRARIAPHDLQKLIAAFVSGHLAPLFIDQIQVSNSNLSGRHILERSDVAELEDDDASLSQLDSAVPINIEHPEIGTFPARLLDSLLETLPSVEKQLIRGRLYEGIALTDLADQLSISQEHAAQIYKRFLQRFRNLNSLPSSDLASPNDS